MTRTRDYSVREAAVELGCSQQLIRYYCRGLGVGTRVGRAPRGVWMLSGQDVDAIAQHRRGSGLGGDGVDARAQPADERRDGVAARGQVGRSGATEGEVRAARDWMTTAEVAALLGVTERAVRARAAVRGVGSRAHARLATYSRADLAELRRAVPRGRPSEAADPA